MVNYSLGKRFGGDARSKLKNHGNHRKVSAIEEAIKVEVAEKYTTGEAIALTKKGSID